MYSVCRQYFLSDRYKRAEDDQIERRGNRRGRDRRDEVPAKAHRSAAWHDFESLWCLRADCADYNPAACGESGAAETAPDSSRTILIRIRSGYGGASLLPASES
jgi:hypothetical protein